MALNGTGKPLFERLSCQIEVRGGCLTHGLLTVYDVSRYIRPHAFSAISGKSVPFIILWAALSDRIPPHWRPATIPGCESRIQARSASKRVRIEAWRRSLVLRAGVGGQGPVQHGIRIAGACSHSQLGVAWPSSSHIIVCQPSALYIYTQMRVQYTFQRSRCADIQPGERVTLQSLVRSDFRRSEFPPAPTVLPTRRLPPNPTREPPQSRMPGLADFSDSAGKPGEVNHPPSAGCQERSFWAGVRRPGIAITPPRAARRH